MPAIALATDPASPAADGGAVPAPADPPVQRHSRLENLQALASGTLLIAFGVGLMARAGLLTGGAPGLAFLLHYLTGWPLGPLFVLVNLPFYAMALAGFGWRFTAVSLAAACVVAGLLEWQSHWLQVQAVAPIYAAVLGGLVIGAGLLMLFRHQASLGGLNVLVLWLQRRFGWPAGRVQMGIDAGIVVLALLVTDLPRVLCSVLGAVVLNLVLAFNHKPGRYLGL
jgi:uncharacterized membrane-anchored protein YitT (DUF2179 family)